MTWTSTTLNVKDAGGTNRAVIAYTDGTNFSFAHSLLDSAGAIVSASNPLAVVLPSPRIVTGNTTTRPNDTAQYAFGDLVANSTTAGSVSAATIAAAGANDVKGMILRCRLKKSGTSITSAIFRIHLYNAAPGVTNGDNGAWLSTESGYQGAFDVTIDKAFSDAAEGIGMAATGAAVNFTPASGTQNLYYLIEARATYTPAANEVFTPIFELAQ